MPAIIQDDKQQAALKEIEEALAIVETLNVALSDKVVISVNAVPETGKSVKVDIEEKDGEKIKSVLEGYKKRLSKEIQAKAKSYRIALNEKELLEIE